VRPPLDVSLFLLLSSSRFVVRSGAGFFRPIADLFILALGRQCIRPRKVVRVRLDIVVVVVFVGGCRLLTDVASGFFHVVRSCDLGIGLKEGETARHFKALSLDETHKGGNARRRRPRVLDLLLGLLPLAICVVVAGGNHVLPLDVHIGCARVLGDLRHVDRTLWDFGLVLFGFSFPVVVRRVGNQALEVGNGRLHSLVLERISEDVIKERSVQI